MSFSVDVFFRAVDILDKTIMKLNEIPKYKKFEKVSFLTYNITDEEKLTKLKSHPLKDKLVIVKDLREINIKPDLFINKIFWRENEGSLLDMTKNSFLFVENRELVLDETYFILEKWSKYYSFVIMFTELELKKKPLDSFFSLKIEGSIYLMINKKLANFTSYTIEDFEKLVSYVKSESLKSLEKGTNIFMTSSNKKESFSLSLDKKEDKKPEVLTPGANFFFLENLSSPNHSPNLDKYNKPSSKVWKQEFYEYIKDILEKIFPDRADKKQLINAILTSKTLDDYWIPCFTHKTANPNPSKNYESIETIGDETLSYCFKFYLKQRDPLATEAAITDLDQRYMSKIFQSKVSKVMKLQDWLISSGIPKGRMDTTEDLLESFFGTIDQLLFNKTGKVGFGVMVVYNFIKKLFDNVSFDKTTIPDRTFVEQIFRIQPFQDLKQVKQQYIFIKKPKELSELDWKEAVDKMNSSLTKKGYPKVEIKKDTGDHPGISLDVSSDPLTGRTSATISILKKYVDRARELGVDLPDTKNDLVIGRSVKSTKKIALKEAFKEAKEYLESKGLTKEWRDEMKKIEQDKVLKRLDEVLLKAKKSFPDLESVNISRNKLIRIGSKDVIPYTIVGKEENGNLVSIFTLPSQDAAFEQGVIDEYLES